MSTRALRYVYSSIARGLEIADKALLIFAGVAVVVLNCMIFFDVVLRFLFNSPIPAATEISELIMPYIAFCVLSYALYTDQHIRITLFHHKFAHNPTVILLLDLFNCLVGLTFTAIMTYYSWNFFWESFVIREELLAVIKVPWYIGKFAMPLGYFFFALRYLFQIVSYLCDRDGSLLETTEGA